MERVFTGAPEGVREEIELVFGIQVKIGEISATPALMIGIVAGAAYCFYCFLSCG
jgi:hypothetical protein